jgi:hypothetical protein
MAVWCVLSYRCHGFGQFRSVCVFDWCDECVEDLNEFYRLEPIDALIRFFGRYQESGEVELVFAEDQEVVNS